MAELGTINSEIVYHLDNVDHYVSVANGHRSIHWQREARRTLTQIGRVVAPRFWPREHTKLPRTGPAVPYSLKEEDAFRLAATLKKESVRAASAAVVSLSLGAGLSAMHIQRATPGDVVDMGQGRLAIWVDPESPTAVWCRFVPVTPICSIAPLNIQTANGSLLGHPATPYSRSPNVSRSAVSGISI